MKRILLVIVVSLFTWTSVGATPLASIVGDQRKDQHQKKKDPPGPPVVKDKGKDGRQKDPPKRDKKPD